MTDEEELRPKRRGRPKKEEVFVNEEVAVTGGVMVQEAPPLTIDQPGVLEDFDRIFGDELTPESEQDLEEMLAQQALEEEDDNPLHLTDEERTKRSYDIEPISTKPTRDKFVDVRGGLYLPVRQRIVWMRGEPVPHPDWLIQTEIVHFEPGTYIAQKTIFLGGMMQDVPDVKGGMAVIRAAILTKNPDGSAGPAVGEGTAMERSELFHDFVEKAETAAIGRAMAVAGYGTEAAADLDEGVAQGNIADAPVRGKPGGTPHDPTSWPGTHESGGGTTITPEPATIDITPSAVLGVRQGGRQQNATAPQINAIRERAKELMLSPSALQIIIREALPMPDGTTDTFHQEDIEDTPDGTNEVLGYLAGLSFEDCGKVVQALMNRE